MKIIITFIILIITTFYVNYANAWEIPSKNVFTSPIINLEIHKKLKFMESITNIIEEKDIALGIFELNDGYEIHVIAKQTIMIETLKLTFWHLVDIDKSPSIQKWKNDTGSKLVRIITLDQLRKKFRYLKL